MRRPGTAAGKAASVRTSGPPLETEPRDPAAADAGVGRALGDLPPLAPRRHRRSAARPPNAGDTGAGAAGSTRPRASAPCATGRGPREARRATPRAYTPAPDDIAS